MEGIVKIKRTSQEVSVTAPVPTVDPVGINALADARLFCTFTFSQAKFVGDAVVERLNLMCNLAFFEFNRRSAQSMEGSESLSDPSTTSISPQVSMLTAVLVTLSGPRETEASCIIEEPSTFYLPPTKPEVSPNGDYCFTKASAVHFMYCYLNACVVFSPRSQRGERTSSHRIDL